MNGKLEPILEERYIIKQPETTKHESSTARGGIPTVGSREGIFIQEVGGMTLNANSQEEAQAFPDEP